MVAVMNEASLRYDHLAIEEIELKVNLRIQPEFESGNFWIPISTIVSYSCSCRLDLSSSSSMLATLL